MVDPNCIVRFLEKRYDVYQKPISNLLHPPKKENDGWFSLALRQYDSSVERMENWRRGWHGAEMEAVYCILFHNYIAESRKISRGESMLASTAGVYLHEDAST